MNAFLECGDFCGENDAGKLSQSIRDFFELAAELRNRLGRQGYLLDSHLNMLLNTASAVPLLNTGEHGFNAAMKLRALIRRVEEGRQEEQEHPLYEKAKAYIDAHPLPYQERYTRHSLYFAALFCEFAEYTAADYLRELPEQIQEHAPFDDLKLQEVRRSICEMLGDESDMERLENLFRQCFFSVTPMAGFVQGMADTLLTEIIYRDTETSRLTFQLMLEANLAGGE